MNGGGRNDALVNIRVTGVFVPGRYPVPVGGLRRSRRKEKEIQKMIDKAMEVMRDFIDENFIDAAKETVEEYNIKSSIVFICNTDTMRRGIVSLSTLSMFDKQARFIVKKLAKQYSADAILSVFTTEFDKDDTCLLIVVETVLGQYIEAHPFTREGHVVNWHNSQQIQSSPLYADLLPKPKWMASA
jgi:hypothetical protein